MAGCVLILGALGRNVNVREGVAEYERAAGAEYDLVASAENERLGVLRKLLYEGRELKLVWKHPG
jgi:hypothetical protein